MFVSNKKILEKNKEIKKLRLKVGELINKLDIEESSYELLSQKHKSDGFKIENRLRLEYDKKLEKHIADIEENKFLKKEIENLKGLLKEHKDNISSLEGYVDISKSYLKKANLKKDKIEDENKLLKEANKKLQDRDIKIDEWKEEINSLSIRVATAEQESKGLQDTNKALNDVIEHQKTIIDKLTDKSLSVNMLECQPKKK